MCTKLEKKVFSQRTGEGEIAIEAPKTQRAENIPDKYWAFYSFKGDIYFFELGKYQMNLFLSGSLQVKIFANKYLDHP